MGSIMAAKLPQELIDEVISHLRDNKDWLSSCSLVNRAWSPFARRLLFRSVYVSPTKLPMTPHEGCPSIEVPDWNAVPHLLGDIMPRLMIWATDLHIKGTTSSTPTRRTIANVSDESGDASDEDSGYSSWQSPNDRWCYIFPSVDTLFAISQVLPRLRHIYLRDLAVTPGTRHPKHPTPLDTLTLNNVGVMLQGNVLWELFRLFSPRQSVLLNVFWKPTTDRTVQESLSAPPPTSFVAHTWRLRGRPSVEYILAHLASTSFTYHAKSLDVALRDEIELQALMQLMRKSASTLTQLKIDMREAFFTFDQDVLMISDIGDVWDEEVDFAVCPSLGSLELGVLMGTTPRSAETLHDISRALSTLPPSINRLRLILDFPFFGPDLLGLPWIEFNMLSSLPNLHTVEFIILKESGVHPIDLDVQNDLLSFFPDHIQSLSNVLQLRFAE